MAAGLSFNPQGPATSRPVCHQAGGERPLKSIPVHPGHHEHVLAARFLRDHRYQAIIIERKVSDHPAQRQRLID